MYLTKRERKLSADDEDDNIAKTVQLMKNKRISKPRKENADTGDKDGGEGEVSRLDG